MINDRLLKSKMILAGDEDFVNAIAGLIGKSRQTAGAKLNGTSEFTNTEIGIISHKYSLTAEEIKTIFTDGVFTDESK